MTFTTTIFFYGAYDCISTRRLDLRQQALYH